MSVSFIAELSPVYCCLVSSILEIIALIHIICNDKSRPSSKMSLQFSGDSLTIQGANIKEQKEYLFQRGHTECNDKKKKDKD